MARFFLGQLVRVNCPHSLHHGEETTITGFDMPGDDWTTGHAFTNGIEVDISHSRTGKRCIYEPHELEPIIPSGHQPAELTVEELLPFLKTREVV